jgi:hypothetical protein
MAVPQCDEGKDRAAIEGQWVPENFKAPFAPKLALKRLLSPF